MFICGPQRYATGLLTAETKDKNCLMTWDDVNFEVESHSPEYNEDRSPVVKDGKAVYHKRKLRMEDFQEVNIRIAPGEVVILQGKTYDGQEVSTTISKCKMSLEFIAPACYKNVEVVDDDAAVPTNPNPKRDRTHEECCDCSKEKIQPQPCNGHCYGETSCPEFQQKIDESDWEVIRTNDYSGLKCRNCGISITLGAIDITTGNWFNVSSPLVCDCTRKKNVNKGEGERERERGRERTRAFKAGLRRIK